MLLFLKIVMAAPCVFINLSTLSENFTYRPQINKTTTDTVNIFSFSSVGSSTTSG